MSSDQSPLLVQSLIGRKNLPFYLECLDSLTRFCHERISLLLHADGSLNKEQMDFALNHFGDQPVQFHNPEEARQVTLDNLEGLPHCQKFRQNSLWGIEFFDPLFVRPDDPISYYVDADILFLRPFSGLFEPKEVEGGAVFLRDIQWDAYCLRPWHLFGFGKHPVIVKGITTALVCWDKRAIDWDYLEWFLSQNKFHRIPEWVMPTAQAGLAKRCQARVVSPTQLPNLYPNASIDKETFGVHLLGSYRDEWRPKVESYAKEMPDDQSPTQVSFEHCQSRGAFAYAANQAKRWVNTRLNRW
jgi:hypothetical protein